MKNIVVDILNYFQTFKQFHCCGYNIITFREKENMIMPVFISNMKYMLRGKNKDVYQKNNFLY